MNTLDRSRSFGEVWGSTGLTYYEQDGRQFSLDGSPLDLMEAAAEPYQPSLPPPPAPPRNELADQAEALGIDVDRRWGERRLRQVIAEHGAAPPDAGKSDADLRTMVELAGGAWTTREAAFAFLADNDE